MFDIRKNFLLSGLILEKIYELFVGTNKTVRNIRLLAGYTVVCQLIRQTDEILGKLGRQNYHIYGQ